MSKADNENKKARKLYNKGRTTGGKVQITSTFYPDMLKEIDVLARRRGLTRNATITLAIAEHLERSRQ